MDDNQATNEPASPAYVPSQAQVAVVEPIGAPGKQTDVVNAFAPGGKPLKFLNSGYEKITLVIEGTDGNPIGSNWVIPKANTFQKPQPLIYNGEKVTINPDQKVKAILPNGAELQRNGFELDKDLIDGSYLWVIK